MPLRGGGRIAGAGAVALGLALAAWRASPRGQALPTGFVVVNSGLLLLGLLLLVAGVSRRLAGGAGERPPGPVTVEVDRAGPPLLGMAIGTGLVSLGPHLSIVFAGAIFTAWSGWLLDRAGSHRLPLAPALTLVLLPAWWLLQTIAGPVGLAVRTLPLVPLSPAAERLIAPALLLTAWALSGLWPWHRQLPGSLSAPAGALVLYRVGVWAMPNGLAHWRTAIFPLLVLGMWHAALTGRIRLVAVGGGMLGLASLEPHGLAGAWWLLAAALALEILERVGIGWTVARAGPALMAAWGGLEVATGGLRTEVVYTVVAVAAVAAAALTPPASRSIFGPTKTG